MTAEQSDSRQNRNPERTRTDILQATVEGLSERGTGVTLAYIAKLAGISKGGLLHHFSSRDTLFTAVAYEAEEKFRQSVQDHVDLSENKPGKFLRAYVRALTDPSDDTREYFAPAPGWLTTFQIPEIAEMIEESRRWWSENLAADGVSPERILVVRRAAEGIAFSLADGDLSAEEAKRARQALLRLADGGQIEDD